MMIVQMVVTESLTKPFTFLFTSIKSFFIDHKIMSKDDWKPEFKETEEIVWLIYYQLTILLAVIYLPYFVLAQPFLIYLIFWAYYLFLMNIAKKPISQSNRDVSTFS